MRLDCHLWLQNRISHCNLHLVYFAVISSGFEFYLIWDFTTQNGLWWRFPVSVEERCLWWGSQFSFLEVSSREFGWTCFERANVGAPSAMDIASIKMLPSGLGTCFLLQGCSPKEQAVGHIFFCIFICGSTSGIIWIGLWVPRNQIFTNKNRPMGCLLIWTDSTCSLQLLFSSSIEMCHQV